MTTTSAPTATTGNDGPTAAAPGRASSPPPAPPRPPAWERAEFRFWVITVSVVAIIAVGLGVAAVALASGKADRAVESGVAAFPGQEIDEAAEPDADFVARDPNAPATPSGTVHRIELEATEQEVEIAPGVTQMMWGFNNLVPGPTLRGNVGDTFEITLTNSGENQHSIDFHASKVAWNNEMRSISPGETLTYRFVAKKAGVFMYHCGTPAVIHHIGNGMYGAIIVNPPDLAPVDHELVMVQSELYTAPEGEIADVNKMLAEQWDGVVFNGFHNQYLHRPIRVEPDERVRVWVLDAGPSENSSFHVIGTIFDTIYKEGGYLLTPDMPGGSQSLDLQPAQGGFVEFTFDFAGLYPYVTHKFASASKGALGLFQAGEVEATDAAH